MEPVKFTPKFKKKKYFSYSYVLWKPCDFLIAKCLLFICREAEWWLQLSSKSSLISYSSCHQVVLKGDTSIAAMRKAPLNSTRWSVLRCWRCVPLSSVSLPTWIRRRSCGRPRCAGIGNLWLVTQRFGPEFCWRTLASPQRFLTPFTNILTVVLLLHLGTDHPLFLGAWLTEYISYLFSLWLFQRILQ